MVVFAASAGRGLLSSKPLKIPIEIDYIFSL
ncbi:hypothetical protein EDC40_11219 [Aminobacter aminovorans]|jgi:hypothetical protein|uniref:Uncharacterized protein n=1 Tax=Aminobacter aminovorans TaxID=83263 RepID=A0A380WEN1_AMIAI|nr:hypothetical protein EDC40_11219 [Aminobacter aminovorans]SUU87225.1 Uncharacterised protein [Aminobacter aminovorans]